MPNPLPILYSFRRCPYAMRARLAIRYSNLQVELREVDLKNKPPEMILASAKATVPVLILNDQTVLDESLDIMYWSLQQSDTKNWLQKNHQSEIEQLIQQNDQSFKTDLDHYKYADRFPQQPPVYYRQQAEQFLKLLEQRLTKHTFLIHDAATLADVALFPFIRQFAYVDIKWFETSVYTNLHRWLTYWLESDLFLSIMRKHSNWSSEKQNITYL
ncbi:MAG: glutathione S-transferase [Gammaproteobacteria bacterium]|nr:glutathione S-transferase [Gammaproteobacteria bacterium]